MSREHTSAFESCCWGLSGPWMRGAAGIWMAGARARRDRKALLITLSAATLNLSSRVTCNGRGEDTLGRREVT